ncbi:MAG: hypothetical protein RBU21_23295 [FCB group bacterium]|jgi:hypothetical protein|nr:hypothetical protein [FCB group bacterium]
MVRLTVCLLLGALAALPSYGAKAPELSLEDVRAAVREHWGAVRDLTVEDKVTRVEYRQVGPLPLPKQDKVTLSAKPNRWMAAPGLEYLELWYGDRCARVSYNGSCTQWEGQRNAFGPYKGRVCEGNNVPNADLTFSYYVGRFGRYSGLNHFLEAPQTRLVKANRHSNEIVYHRVRGVADVDIDGTVKPYEVTLDLAPDYGWLPFRAEFVDTASGQPVRVYKVRSFFNVDGFPFPREAQIDFYATPVPAGNRTSTKAVLTTSLMCHVLNVAVNRGVGPGDFAFDFTPGTEVRDERSGETFVVPEELAPEMPAE